MRKIFIGILTCLAVFIIFSSLTGNTNAACGKVCITQISPAEDDTIFFTKPTIIVDLKSESEIDENNSFLKVNGEEVEFKITQNAIYYEIDTPLDGLVTVETRITDIEGNFDTRKWSFKIAENSPEVIYQDDFAEMNTSWFGLPPSIVILASIILCVAVAVFVGIILVILFLMRSKE